MMKTIAPALFCSVFQGARALAAAALGVDVHAAAVHVAASLSQPQPSSSSSPLLPQLLVLQRLPSPQFPLNRNWANPQTLVEGLRFVCVPFPSHVILCSCSQRGL